jgi:prevent-host-death family protein
MEIGVRELKQHLSEYLARAAVGETIRVTDRGEAKALITPIPSFGSINLGVEEGWIRPSNGEGLRPVRRVGAKRPTLDVLAEDRGEVDE